VVAITLLELLHFGRKLAHLGHGAEARGGKMEEGGLDCNHQQNDGDSPVTYKAVDPANEVEQRQTNKPQGTVINGALKVRCNFLEAVDILGPGIELGRDYALLSRCHLMSRAGESKQELIGVGQFAQEKAVSFISLGNPGGDEVMLNHGHPAALVIEGQRAFGNIAEIEFSVLFVRRGGGGSQEPADTKTGAAARNVIVALDLPIKVGGPQLVAAVGHQVGEINQVIATVEGIAFGDGHVTLLQTEVYIQAVAAIIQNKFGLLYCKHRSLTIGQIGGVGANQAALRDVHHGLVAVEQHQWVRTVQLIRVAQQGDFDDIAAVSIDKHFES